MARRVYRSMGLPSAVAGGKVAASDPRYAKGAFEKDLSGKSPMQSYADQYVATPAYKDLVKQTANIRGQAEQARAMSAQVAEENAKLRAASDKIREDTRLQKEHTDSRIAMAKKKYGSKWKSIERRMAGGDRSLATLARLGRAI